MTTLRKQLKSGKKRVGVFIRTVALETRLWRWAQIIICCLKKASKIHEAERAVAEATSAFIAGTLSKIN
jgi:hypothetical protein